jgi:hypothetical protein
LDRARPLYEESLEVFRRLHDAVGELQAIGNLGQLEIQCGNAEGGSELLEKSRAMAREIGWLWWESMSVADLAENALDEGRTATGEAHAREFLALSRRMEARELMVYGLALLAWAAADRGDPARAATLWAAVEAEEAKGPLASWARERENYARHIPEPSGRVAALALADAVSVALDG